MTLVSFELKFRLIKFLFADNVSFYKADFAIFIVSQQAQLPLLLMVRVDGEAILEESGELICLIYG